MSALNNEFPFAVREWFISMGYPLEDVEHTDWNVLCSGRLSIFWKKIMKFVKSKHDILNIRRNILLKETKKYEQRKDSAASLLGYVLPPPQIHYANEQKKMSEKLALIQAEITKKREKFQKVNDERKRKCFEMNEIKSDISKITYQIFLTKEIVQTLQNDIDQFDHIANKLQMFKNSFKNPLKCEPVNESEFEEFQKYLSSHSENESANENIEDNFLVDDSDLLSNSLLATTVIYNNEPSHEAQIIMKKKETFELLQLIQKHHASLLYIIDQNASLLLQSKSKEIDRFVNNGQLSTYRKGLNKMDLLHSQILIETIKIKKHTKKTKAAASLINLKILEKLSDNNIKLQAFRQQSSLFTGSAYKKSISKELSDLKAKNGFYAMFNNNAHTNKIIPSECSILTLECCKKKYMEIYFDCTQKLKSVVSHLNKLKTLNMNISKKVKQLKEITGSEKILWDSNNEDLQKIYMKVILNNPNAFKFEKENSFEGLIHLREILTEFKVDINLEETAGLISQELQIFKTYSDNSSRFLFEKSKTQNEALLQQLEISKKILACPYMEYLRPMHYFIYFLIKMNKFSSSLLKFTDLKYDVVTPKIILGQYLENKLVEQEEQLLSEIEENFPNSFTTMITKPFINDFYITYDFFVEFSKNKNTAHKSFESL